MLCFDTVLESFYQIYVFIDFVRTNKAGIIGTSCIGVVFIGFIQISWVEGRELTLTKSEIYDYTFTACIMDGEDTLCPSYRLNHTVNLSLSIHEHPITE